MIEDDTPDTTEPSLSVIMGIIPLTVSPGRILATPGAMEALHCTGQSTAEFLARHVSGDWGDLCEADRYENDLNAIDGGRLLSAYYLSDGTPIWLITEADRSVTTFLLPCEY